MQSQHFFGLDGLTDLSKRSGIDMRPTLLRVLTDLYVQRLSHSADEERHYTELAMRMLERIDRSNDDPGIADRAKTFVALSIKARKPA